MCMSSCENDKKINSGRGNLGFGWTIIDLLCNLNVHVCMVDNWAESK
jgi:hypothetical protein